MAESSLLSLPAELRGMIWKEVLGPVGVISLRIDYQHLYDRYEIPNQIRFGRGTSFFENLIAMRKMKPTGKIKLPFIRCKTVRPLPQLSLFLLQVSKQIHEEYSAVFFSGNSFDLSIDMGSMSRAHGWDPLIFFLSNKGGVKLGTLTITEVSRRAECDHWDRGWYFRQLTTSLIPLLLDHKFDNLRLCYELPAEEYCDGCDNHVSSKEYIEEIEGLTHVEKGRLNYKVEEEGELYDEHLVVTCSDFKRKTKKASVSRYSIGS